MSFRMTDIFSFYTYIIEINVTLYFSSCVFWCPLPYIKRVRSTREIMEELAVEAMVEELELGKIVLEIDVLSIVIAKRSN